MPPPRRRVAGDRWSPAAGHRAGPPAESIGPLLARLRLRHGHSQLRLAEQLCAASGVPTVTRHEVSRWEREERVPGRFWLGWLAAVLEVPAETLAAAARARPPDAARAQPPDAARAQPPDAAPARPGAGVRRGAHATPPRAALGGGSPGAPTASG